VGGKRKLAYAALSGKLAAVTVVATPVMGAVVVVVAVVAELAVVAVVVVVGQW
jgi:hypothetical protein